MSPQPTLQYRFPFRDHGRNGSVGPGRYLAGTPVDGEFQPSTGIFIPP